MNALTHLQAPIALHLTDRLLRKDMPAGHEVDGLDIRSQLLGRDGTDPSFASALHIRSGTAALGVDLELQLDDVPQPLHPSAQDLLAVCLRADALRLLAGKQELQDRILVVEVPNRV